MDAETKEKNDIVAAVIEMTICENRNYFSENVTDDFGMVVDIIKKIL